MKSLITLIKLHTQNLDELRRKMVALENQKAQLLQLSAKLKGDLASEIRTASQHPEMGNFFGDYAKRNKQRQEEIAREVAALDKQMTDLNMQIVAAYSEVKKYEIALENAKRRAKAETERQEVIALDEMAGQQFTRKQKTTEDQ